MLGSGKYDDLCTFVRESAQADAALVIVFNGKRGHGFSVQAKGVDLTAALPEILEEVARDIRASLAPVAPGPAN